MHVFFDTTKPTNIEQYMKKLFYALSFFCLLQNLSAHPMPNSIVSISVQPNGLDWTITMPLREFSYAFKNPVTAATQDSLKDYFQQHLKIIGSDKIAWQLTFIGFQIERGQNEAVGEFEELIVKLHLQPAPNQDLRHFELQYDVITHQVLNHETLIYVRDDWENGLHEAAQQVGIAAYDIPTATIAPLYVSLEKGSTWKGFISMVQLGMQHIAEGTDHLLFLLVLLLAAPLLVNGGHWGSFGGWRYCLGKLLRIITAFTVGHSITLLLGTLGYIPFSSRWIEVGIAISILVSAVHALRPLFFNREVYIAAGFGLIHGLAFSNTLTALHLDYWRMGLSILGFNIGIELMQMAVMLLVIPWLLLLSQTQYYAPFRIGSAILAAIVSIAWIFERVSDKGNFITQNFALLAPYTAIGLMFLAVFSMLLYFYRKKM
jgi:HupE / UreJ protein